MNQYSLFGYPILPTPFPSIKNGELIPLAGGIKITTSGLDKLSQGITSYIQGLDIRGIVAGKVFELPPYYVDINNDGIPEPLISGGILRIDEFQYNNISIAIRPNADCVNSLFFTGSMDSPAFTVYLHVTLLDIFSIELTGTASASNLILSGGIDLSIVDKKIVANSTSCIPFSAELLDPRIDVQTLPDWMDELLTQLFTAGFKEDIQKIIADNISKIFGEGITVIDFQELFPRELIMCKENALDDKFVKFSIIIQPTFLHIDNTGIFITISAGFDILKDSKPVNVPFIPEGFLFTPDNIIQFESSRPVYNDPYDFAFKLSDDFINGFLYSLYMGSCFTFFLDPQKLSSLSQFMNTEAFNFILPGIADLFPLSLLILEGNLYLPPTVTFNEKESFINLPYFPLSLYALYEGRLINVFNVTVEKSEISIIPLIDNSGEISLSLQINNMGLDVLRNDFSDKMNDEKIGAVVLNLFRILVPYISDIFGLHGLNLKSISFYNISLDGLSIYNDNHNFIGIYGNLTTNLPQTLFRNFSTLTTQYNNSALENNLTLNIQRIHENNFLCSIDESLSSSQYYYSYSLDDLYNEKLTANPRFTIPYLLEGLHNLKVKVFDKNGFYKGTLYKDFYVDSIPPDFDIKVDKHLNFFSIEPKYKEDGTVFSLKLSENNWQIVVSNKFYPIEKNTQTLVVKAVDRGNNIVVKEKTIHPVEGCGCTSTKSNDVLNLLLLIMLLPFKYLLKKTRNKNEN